MNIKYEVKNLPSTKSHLMSKSFKTLKHCFKANFLFNI